MAGLLAKYFINKDGDFLNRYNVDILASIDQIDANLVKIKNIQNSYSLTIDKADIDIEVNNMISNIVSRLESITLKYKV